MARTFSGASQWYEWTVGDLQTPFCYAVRLANLTGNKFLAGIGSNSADNHSSMQTKTTSTAGSVLHNMDWPTNTTVSCTGSGVQFNTPTYYVGYCGSRSNTDHWARKTGSAETTTTTSHGIDAATISRMMVGCAGNSAHTTANAADIAEMCVWNTTISDDDRLAIESGVSMNIIKPGNIKLYWGGLNGANSLTNGTPSTITGSPAWAGHPSLYLPA